MPSPSWDILLITDERAPCGVEASVRRALTVGAAATRVAVLLRVKRSPADTRRALAESLRSITRARDVPLLIHNDVELALAVAADGVHLKSHGTSPRRARSQLGPDKYLGRSCHGRDELEFESASLDYATLSPFFPVPGKAPPLPLPLAAQLITEVPHPVFALGGIGPAEVPRVMASGAHGVAVIRSGLGAAAPERALQALLDALDRPRIPR